MNPETSGSAASGLLDYVRNAFILLGSSTEDAEMPRDWTDLLANIAKIKLRGGVVGKVCTVIMVVVVAIAAIAVAVRVEWIAIAALGLIFILAFTLLWRLMNFAENYPQAALLDGAEFIAHERMKLGTKARPIINIDDPKIQPVPTLPAPAVETIQPEVLEPEGDK